VEAARVTTQRRRRPSHEFEEETMRRKASLWIVIALVGALAAATAAAVVLAQRDDRPDDPGAYGRVPAGWSHPESEANGEWQGPVMGSVAGWEGDDETPILPWVLFAVATGTAVGLLVAWSPWRAGPATVTVATPQGHGDVGAQGHATPHAAAPEMVVAETVGEDATETLAEATSGGEADEVAEATGADRAIAATEAGDDPQKGTSVHV
jgi:hypothetical protein